MFDTDDSIFPSKPELIVDENKSSTMKFVLSSLLFIAVFVSLFLDNYLFIIEVIAVLLIHELGHFIMMRKYGYKTANTIFVPFLGTISVDKTRKISQKQKVIIALMGPLPGIIIGCTLLIYYLNFPFEGIVLELALLFLAVNLLNLIPIDPLDGGHFIESVFFPTKEKFKMIFTLLSSFILIGAGYYLSFYILMVFGFFMAFKVRSYQKNQKIHEDLTDINLDFQKTYTELSNREYWTIRRVFLDSNPKIKDIIPNDMVLWENEKLLVDQIKQILRTEVVLDLKIGLKMVLLAVFILAIVIPGILLIQNWELIAAYFGPNV